MNEESMTTIGCLLAMVFALDSGEITSSSEGEVRMTYCHTTESETNNLIVTPQMRQLGEAGFLPIAVARVQRDDVSQFYLFAVRGLSEGLRSALEHQGCDVIHDALSTLADGQNIPPVSN
jgi:hypothetical protein